jgi:predicted nucleotidyltransferase
MNRQTSKAPVKTPRYYSGVDIPLRVIRAYAKQIVERFHPDKIILFGSRAYGTPHEDSDVDLLVVMPARNTLDQAAKIHWSLLPNFPLDLIVRRPADFDHRIKDGDSFLIEINSKGKVLYEERDARVGSQSRARPRMRSQTNRPRIQ